MENVGLYGHTDARAENFRLVAAEYSSVSKA